MDYEYEALHIGDYLYNVGINVAFVNMRNDVTRETLIYIPRNIVNYLKPHILNSFCMPIYSDVIGEIKYELKTLPLGIENIPNDVKEIIRKNLQVEIIYNFEIRISRL